MQVVAKYLLIYIDFINTHDKLFQAMLRCLKVPNFQQLSLFMNSLLKALCLHENEQFTYLLLVIYVLAEPSAMFIECYVNWKRSDSCGHEWDQKGKEQAQV